MRKKYVIDIDGTICITKKKFKDMQKNYKAAKPRIDVINKINDLFDKGNIIFFYTSRPWVDFELTVKWLKKYSVKYHSLVFGKPVGHIYIDEKYKLLCVEDLLK